MREEQLIGRRASALARMLSSKLAQNPESWGFDRAELRAAIRRDIVSWAKRLDSTRPLSSFSRTDTASLGRIRVKQRQSIYRRQEKASAARDEAAAQAERRALYCESISAAHMHRSIKAAPEVIFEGGGVEAGLSMDESRWCTRWLRLRSNFQTELDVALQQTEEALLHWPPPTATELNAPDHSHAAAPDPPRELQEPPTPCFKDECLVDEAFVKDAVYTLANPAKWSVGHSRAKTRLPVETATYAATKTLRKPDLPERDHPTPLDLLYNHPNVPVVKKSALLANSRVPLTARHLITAYLNSPQSIAGLPPPRDRNNIVAPIPPSYPALTNNLHPWWINNEEQDPLWMGIWYSLTGLRDSNQLEKAARNGRTCLSDLCRTTGLESGPVCTTCVASVLRPAKSRQIKLPLSIAQAPLVFPTEVDKLDVDTVYDCTALRKRWIKHRIHAELCDVLDELELCRTVRVTRPSVRIDLIKRLALKDGFYHTRTRFRQWFEDCICARLPPVSSHAFAHNHHLSRSTGGATLCHPV